MRSLSPQSDTRLSYDDWVLFPDDGKRHEIIDGEHYVTPSPNVRHQEIVIRLAAEIVAYLKANPGVGRVFVAPLDVVLSRHDVVEPDLLVVTADQTTIVTEKNIQGPPALVVEVLSKGTRKRDAQTKRRLFERTGVREYWLGGSRTRHRPGVPALCGVRAQPRGRAVGGRRPGADDALAPRVRHRPARAVPRCGLSAPIAPQPYLISTSSIASRLGPSISTAR